MERTYRASNGVFAYALFLLFDAFVLGWEGWRRLHGGGPIAGTILAGLAIVCLGCAAWLAGRWGRMKVVVKPDVLIVEGELPVRRMNWADVERVREVRGPAYQMKLHDLLPGPYLPHGLFRGERTLELLARPGMRVVIREALVEGFGSLREDVLRLVPKGTAVDLHSRWWRAEK